jgi:alkylation response protein AidB-like acyl-CoA dehydrogenase
MLRAAGRLDDPCAREMLGEAQMLDIVGNQLDQRIALGISSGRMSDQSAAIGRLFYGAASMRSNTIAFEIAGGAGAAWSYEDDGLLAQCGYDFLLRRVACIGGGTTEMARNVISERVLGMPRERTVDRDVPFRDVPHSPSGRSS